jgi:hypothetical protein
MTTLVATHISGTSVKIDSTKLSVVRQRSQGGTQVLVEGRWVDLLDDYTTTTSTWIP